MRKYFYLVGLACVALIALTGYFLLDSRISASSRAMALPVDPAPLVAETAQGDKSFTIEVADDADERASGLMFRETMDDSHGMLFVFPQTQMVSFWMKDTPMPLDLVFIGQDGKVRDIEQGQPLSEAPISPGEPVRFVLELKAGTAEREGISDGAMLRHPVIAQRGVPGSGD